MQRSSGECRTVEGDGWSIPVSHITVVDLPACSIASFTLIESTEEKYHSYQEYVVINKVS